MANYNYEAIMQGIINGEIDSLMVVQESIYSIDCSDDMDLEDNNLFFAGTTVLECQQRMDELEKKCEVGEFQIVYLDALSIGVNPELFSEYDEEYDDAESVLKIFIENMWDEKEFDNVSTDDWGHREIMFDDESILGSVVVYWAWKRYVGYARRFVRLEYVTDYNMTNLNCSPIDQAEKIQIALLLNHEEIMSCRTSSQLRDLLQQEIDDMGKWEKSPNIDQFLSTLYHDAKIEPMMYELPGDDLYEIG